MNSRQIRRLTWLSVVLTAAALGGCGKDSNSRNASVQGNVTIDGELATRGSVTFYPKGDGPVATGQILADGSYSLRIGLGNIGDPDASKIYSGEYVAIVIVNDPADRNQTAGEGRPPIAGPRLTAIKYAKKETSGLEFAVKSGRNVFPLILDGAASDPSSAEGTEAAADTDVKALPDERIDEPTNDTSEGGVSTPSDTDGDSEEGGEDTRKVELDEASEAGDSK